MVNQSPGSSQGHVRRSCRKATAGRTSPEVTLVLKASCLSFRLSGHPAIIAWMEKEYECQTGGIGCTSTSKDPICSLLASVLAGHPHGNVGNALMLRAPSLDESQHGSKTMFRRG